MSELPPGFVLDEPAPDASGLPPGFVLDAPGDSSAAGIAKSLGVGLAEGGIGIAGIPGDLSNLLAKGSQAATDYIADKIGIDPGPRARGPVLPTSAGIQKAVEAKTGEFYKPQGAAEEIANRIGQFAPGVVGGPEALATKALTRVIAPAVASEAAGKAMEGTAAQPYAEIAGALLGGAGASAGLNKLTALRTASADLSPAQLKAASRAGYQHPDVQDVRINPDAVLDLSDRIKADLQHGLNSGFRPANEPKVFSAVDELGAPAEQGRSATVADLDNVRQVLGNAAKEKDAIGQSTRQAVAASRAIDHIDNFLPSLKQSDLLAGDAAKANAILEKSRGDWAAYKKSSQVRSLLSDAEINAASSHSGGNIQNATKQVFKPLLKKNAAKVASWSDDEKAALNRIVRGTWPGALARGAGNLLGGGGGLGMLAGAGAGYEAGGLPGAIAAGVAGRGLKMIGNRSTFNAVQRLDGLIRSRAPEALRVAAQNPQIAAVLPPKSIRLLRTMILAEPTLRSVTQKNREAVGQPGS